MLPRTLLRCALPAALATSMAVAAPAHAADAPTRLVDLNAAGARTGGAVLGIGPGAREVILRQPTTSNTFGLANTVVRDVVANRTTELLPTTAEAWAVSDDAQRILFSSAVAYAPTDRNTATDLYVLDRLTGRALLISRDATGAAIGLRPDRGLRGAISGDGRSVVWSPTADDGAGSFRTEVDGATPSAKVTDAPLLTFRDRLDTTGRVTIAKDGIYLGGSRRIDAATTPIAGLADAKASANGAVVVDLDGYDATSYVLRAFDLTAGAVRTVPLPSWVRAQQPALISVGPDGASAALAVRQQRGTGGTLGSRLVLGTIDLRTGALAQLGADLPWSGSTWSVTSADWQFASSGGVIAQLGTTPIPGTAPTPVPTPPFPATDYLSLYPGCRATSSLGFAVNTRPSLTLSGALGIAPQVPAKAEVTVTITSTGAVANRFTLTGVGARRDLTTGFGNFTIAAKITFTDGTSVTGTRAVTAYRPDPCPAY